MVMDQFDPNRQKPVILHAKYSIDDALEGEDFFDDDFEPDDRDELVDELREDNSTDYSPED